MNPSSSSQPSREAAAAETGAVNDAKPAASNAELTVPTIAVTRTSSLPPSQSQPQSSATSEHPHQSRTDNVPSTLSAEATQPLTEHDRSAGDESYSTPFQQSHPLSSPPTRHPHPPLQSARPPYHYMKRHPPIIRALPPRITKDSQSSSCAIAGQERTTR